jgi:hypothetical protein
MTPKTFHNSGIPSAHNPFCQGSNPYFLPPSLRRTTSAACPIPLTLLLTRFCLTTLLPSSIQIISTDISIRRTDIQRALLVSSTLLPRTLLLVFGTCLLGVERCIFDIGSSIISARLGIFGPVWIEAVFVLGVFAGFTEFRGLIEWADSRYECDARVDAMKSER